MSEEDEQMDSPNMVENAVIVGLFPSIAMTLATFLLTKVNIPIELEASLQNFAAGLIISAVGCELFPVMVDSAANASYVGITIGFCIGLSVIYGMDNLVTHIEENNGTIWNNPPKDDDSSHQLKEPQDKLTIKSLPKGMEKLPTDEILFEELKVVENENNWDEDDIINASKALKQPEHRNHIQEHLQEVSEILKFIQMNSKQLMNRKLSLKECELIAEVIDERLHTLQYKLDHSRRLLQGSESAADRLNKNEGPIQNPLHNSCTMNTTDMPQWMTAERKEAIVSGIQGLIDGADHLLDHIAEPILDKSVVKEMRIHMEYMNKQIEKFHHSIENVTERWHRSLPKIEINEGDKLPMGMIIPVFMDAMTDGFLLGISSTISLKAGIILSFANCLEMSFLGMAYASRLVKCTGSSFEKRTLALYGPAFIMFISSIIGGAIGSAVQDITAVYVAMVSFGAVALLYLVTNELLIEARESQGDDNKWYISIMIFVGIYIVLMLNHVL